MKLCAKLPHVPNLSLHFIYNTRHARALQAFFLPSFSKFAAGGISLLSRTRPFAHHCAQLFQRFFLDAGYIAAADVQDIRHLLL